MSGQHLADRVEGMIGEGFVKFILPLPPSANKLYKPIGIKGTGVVSLTKSRQYRIYEDEAGTAMIAQHNLYKLKKVLPDAPLAFTARFYWPDRRIRDTDNPLKALIDVVSRRVGFDDSEISEIHAYRDYDKRNPRVEVELRSSLGSAREAL